MNEEQTQRIIDSAREEPARGCTQERAIYSLKEIGILDENGEVYPHRYGLIWAMHMYPNCYQ